MTPGVIAGIVIGCVAGAALLFFLVTFTIYWFNLDMKLIYWFYHKMKNTTTVWSARTSCDIIKMNTWKKKPIIFWKN